NYLIESCNGAACTNFTQIASTTATTYSNTGLAPSTTYRYRVRATDAANNLRSEERRAGKARTTRDTQQPKEQRGLTETAVSAIQITLAYSSSADCVAVTNYLIESCNGAACTNFTQIASTTATTYSNTGLAPSTTFRYRVRATDAANNL